jgi:hypothetical protein
MITIRGHHLLCINGFQGYGYNKDFIDNLHSIVSNLRSNKEIHIKVIDSPDDICEKCPFRVDNECKQNPCAEETLSTDDRKVIKKLGLKTNGLYRIGEIFDLIEKRIKSVEDLEELGICSRCEWRNVCKFYEQKANDARTNK